jgi:F-type H+-transporting ATPase subunit epsilon
MSANIIKFEIATPERVVLREDIVQVTVPTKQGEITVLPGHIPLVASLMPGVIEIRKPGGQADVMSVSGGFIEVLKDKVVILADTAERAEELDEARIETARQKAEAIKQDVVRADQSVFTDMNARIAKELARGRALSQMASNKRQRQRLVLAA